MKTSASTIQNQFNCTQLEACEIYPRTKALLGHFESLNECYSVENVEASQSISKELGAPLQPSTPLLKALTDPFQRRQALAQWKIRGRLKAMWETYRACVLCEKELLFAHDVFGFEGPRDSFITELFDVLHSVGEIRSPEKIVAGREAYDVLQNSGLAYRLGFVATFYERDWR